MFAKYQSKIDIVKIGISFVNKMCIVLSQIPGQAKKRSAVRLSRKRSAAADEPRARPALEGLPNPDEPPAKKRRISKVLHIKTSLL